ncbi:hypothetical protein DFH09DRAFT_1468405 [Mycena vulgaris]|nr:hypothetical protein DFH09DRAFT_1468405 [Mycena vulgaris]
MCFASTAMNLGHCQSRRIDSRAIYLLFGWTRRASGVSLVPLAFTPPPFGFLAIPFYSAFFHKSRTRTIGTLTNTGDSIQLSIRPNEIRMEIHRRTATLAIEYVTAILHFRSDLYAKGRCDLGTPPLIRVALGSDSPYSGIDVGSYAEDAQWM